MNTTNLSVPLLRKLYARMLLTRMVDEHLVRLHTHGYGEEVASCRGHEATQVGSAICIEVGQDFTLPYYRDLGVVLTIGMTPYEIFRTYLQAQAPDSLPCEQGQSAECSQRLPATHMALPHWGYQKRNAIMGTATGATHILHAAGIAFACKLRKAPVVTVAYCGDGVTGEPDFWEGIRFAIQHQLPAIFICEHDCSMCVDEREQMPSRLQQSALPEGLTHRRLDGTDVAVVYSAMQQAIAQARAGHGPVLLEMEVVRSNALSDPSPRDPLARCQQLLEQQEAWDQQWADALYHRLLEEVEQALHNALQDTLPVTLLPEHPTSISPALTVFPSTHAPTG